MIHLTGTNLYLYEQPIAHHCGKGFACVTCSNVASPTPGAIVVTGWLAQKSGGKVRRRYCPTCSKLYWPIKYRKALMRLGAR